MGRDKGISRLDLGLTWRGGTDVGRGRWGIPVGLFVGLLTPQYTSSNVRMELVVAPPQPKFSSWRPVAAATTAVYPLVAPDVGAGWYPTE